MASSRMKVLVVGGGGREHALAWRLRRSDSVERVEAAPGNAGIADVARCHAIAGDDVPALVELARSGRYDLVVVGPERPLSLGLADALAAEGIRVFGCSKAAAEIEASKEFAKALMVRAGVPTADYRAFESDEIAEAVAYGARHVERAGRVVIKADGLAAGKGVVICESRPEVEPAVRLLFDLSGGARPVVVEEFLVGREASCMALVSGESVYSLPACEDHKTLGDGDRGPMTGGMGAISPTPVVDGAMAARVEREVLVPTARAMAEAGRPFHGLLYAGLMITADGPRVLEFNCRFGDPETQALMPRIRGDFAAALLAIAEGRAPSLAYWPVASCTVVLAAPGYPGTVERGGAIDLQGLHRAGFGGTQVFHAGTRWDGDVLRVDGGRVLSVTATGADLAAARERAYASVSKIRFPGMQYRHDIGARPTGR